MAMATYHRWPVEVVFLFRCMLLVGNGCSLALGSIVVGSVASSKCERHIMFHDKQILQSYNIITLHRVV